MNRWNDIKKCKQIQNINILGRRINFFGFKYQQCYNKQFFFFLIIINKKKSYENLKKKLRNILNDKFNYVKNNIKLNFLK